MSYSGMTGKSEVVSHKSQGKGKEENEPDSEQLNFGKSLPSSSTKKTTRSKVLQKKVNSEKVKPSKKFSLRSSAAENLFQEPSESESDHSVWNASAALKRDRWNSDDEESAGTSKTDSPEFAGMIKSRLSLVLLLKDLELKNLPGEFNYGNEPLNREKNRYRDILPYDSTRVPLGKSMDYINASYIRIVNHGEENFYIATQGPLPHTTNDFWQMVLENNSNVIAMITRDVEDGVMKCHNYWPISLKISQVISVTVKCYTGTSHSVKHLQFTNWPDHGTPTSADDFIKYVRYVRKSHLTGPIVVHCSAGVGRTGVFICVDAVFCAIEKNFSFSFENIVTQMREQRSGMIQTKALGFEKTLFF
ncbi:protein tyrosine phosphatase, non-receptor type 20 [Ictidomys tridecemlineatus]|nr:protein tyrosine phosphatase, non-receptor type 20 [Ictidomys tridecemlineatus]